MGMVTASPVVRGRGPAEAARLAALLEEASTSEVIAWAVGAFGPGLALATSFGRDGIVLLDHLRQHRQEVPILFLETGYHFPETLSFRDRLEHEWGLKVTNLTPSPAAREEAARASRPPYEVDPDRCCQLRKVEPLMAALHGYTAWISGLRRDQHPGRNAIPIVEWQDLGTDGAGIFRVHPLAKWSLAQVDAYLVENHLPRHPLWDQGYSSVGCAPCTRKVLPGEAERAGRWSGSSKIECGIHVVGVHREVPDPVQGSPLRG